MSDDDDETRSQILSIATAVPMGKVLHPAAGVSHGVLVPYLPQGKEALELH